MSEQKHTPGPWTVDSDESIAVRPNGDGGRVCTLNWLRGRQGLNGRREANEVEANARLIAAAPDMLAALTEIVSADEAALAELASFGVADLLSPAIHRLTDMARAAI